MLLAKIRNGILQVSDEGGVRFFRPALAQRLRLVWIFRNFQILPKKVLKEGEQQLVGCVCRQGTVMRPTLDELECCLIGQVELGDPAKERFHSDQEQEKELVLSATAHD
jgi:hypothetical protein